MPLAQAATPSEFMSQISRQVGGFLPSLVGAIAILVIGWLIAVVAASVVKGVLKRTRLDDRIANWFLGQSPEQDVPIEEWSATAVFWLIFIFVIVAFLRALNLEVVSEPLNGFLETIFAYLPRIGGAALLLGIAWVIATLVKLLVTRGLARFNLDDQLVSQAGTSSPIAVNETLGNVLYWFIFLLFLPLILSALDLQGLLQPVNDLIDQFLSAIPQILTAGIVLAIGWLIARIVRGIVTNLLSAMGADQLGARVGLAPAGDEGISLSSLTGTVVFVLILLPTVIAALNELDIQAISAPAVQMLEDILVAVPQILMAGLVIVVFYFVGKFVADLVVGILQSLGFDSVLRVLGLPDITAPSVQATPALDAEGRPVTTVQSPGKTPSEIVGIIVLVGIVLFGVITATEILQFAQLTVIVQAILRISARVLSGIIVFAIGLYLANLAFRVVSAMGGGQANILAQTARISIVALVGAMALQQMGVATNIVNLAFGLLLGAISVAVAIMFGLGGREVAGDLLREWVAAFKQRR
ncbi:hypothetical protein C7271_12695 [filamentous cyanobacterium CCP5]|nr:hypothetical protein C7271_12695 [filamentous cyanobacterium CCP5]